MPININSFWTSIQGQANIWRTGFLSPSKFNDYVNQASLELFTEKVLAYLQNNKIDDDLAPFQPSVNLPVTTPEGLNYGLVTRPSDYTYFGFMRAFFTGTIEAPESCGCPTSDNKACEANQNLQQEEVPVALIPIVKEVKVTKVSNAQWDAALMHRTKYPTLDKPICTQFNNGFKIAPRNLSIVTLDYFKQPTAAVFGYTELPSGYYQYSAATSTDIPWGSQVKNELIDRVLKLFSIQVRNPTLFGMADNQKATRV